MAHYTLAGSPHRVGRPEAQQRGDLPPPAQRFDRAVCALRFAPAILKQEVATKRYKIAVRREIAVKAIAVGLSAIISIGIGFAAAQNEDSDESQPLMHIHDLYADAKGETHFRDIEIEPATEGPGGKVSGRFPATGVVVRTTEGSYIYDWHTAPQRQYVINLDAAVKVTASDGQSRVIGPGEILLVEDTRGKGHVSRVDGKFRHSTFVTLD